MITLKGLTEEIIKRTCSCEKNLEIFKKNDEYLLLLLKISSVRMASTLQNIIHHVNGMFNCLHFIVLIN